MDMRQRKWNDWFMYFIVYCFTGWVYELLVFQFEYGLGWQNRGFLFGPYLPVYGFGGIAVVLLLSKPKERRIYAGKINITPAVVFISIVLITTVLELGTSYIMEIIVGKGQWLWDYSMYKINFEGRIALNSSLRFGVIGIAGLYLVQPVLEKISGRFRAKEAYTFATYGLAVVFMTDVIARVFLGSNY